MDHSFNVEVAEKYGVTCAVFIQNLYFWITKNEANGRHYYEGRSWTYNSLTALEKLFPYFTRKQIRTVIDKCVASGAVVVGQFSKKGYDRTNWYALTEEVWNIYGGRSPKGTTYAQMGTPCAEKGTTISDSKPDSKQSCSGSYAREELAEIAASYEQNIGGPIPRAAFDEAAAFVEDGLPPQLVCRAIQEAAVQGKRSWSYARAILRRCKQEGIDSVAAFEHSLRRNAPRAAASPAAQESFEARMARLADEMTGGAP